MHGATIFEVAAEGHFQAIEGALGFVDAEQVEQGLGRVLVGAITAIDDRYAGKLGGQTCCAFLRMTHNNRVGVGGDHANGVGEGFAFLAERGVLAIGKADHRTAQAMYGCFKREARTG